MPIYEFHCPGCGRDFEELVFSRQAKASCPACGRPECEKLISAPTFRSKGPGGETVSASAGGGCSGCAGTSCASCGSGGGCA